MEENNPGYNSQEGEAAASPAGSERVSERVIEDEMKQSYLDYAMSVIVGRALPEARDGLKPVHRRILYAMNEMGMHHNKPFKKSARIVGEVLGKYHPHGDSAVYDALVRLAQDFSMRYPLIQGQGNFGSIDGDNPAAMRYTEARLTKLAETMLEDINKNTVEFVPNFDESLKEPVVLPSKMPNLLLNGSNGIAVGMATNIPPHNMREVSDAFIALIDNPDISVPELMEHLPGPDFPTGGIILGRQGIARAYATGRGKIKVRGKSHIEDKGSKQQIIITEIPYMVNKAMLLEQIAQLVREKRITGISDLRDESDREGMRIVIELKKDANPDIVLNQLYAHTRLQSTFGIILLALSDNVPKVMNIKELMNEFLQHRKTVIRRRTEFDLGKAEERQHIVEGLLKALDNIDEIIELIKKSADVKEASAALQNKYALSEKQAGAILEMRLQKLTGLEQAKLKEEHEELEKQIINYKKILSSDSEILKIIKNDFAELSSQFGDERRTEIIEYEDDLDIEDLIKPEDMVVTITHSGYIKRLPLQTYKVQGRGGKGVRGAGTREEDFVEHLFVANTHSYLLVFTSTGKVHWLKVYQIPEAGRTAKGKAIVNLLELDKGETVNTVIPVKEFSDSAYLFMTTKKGTVKKTSLSAYSRPRKGGIKAILLEEGDELMDVKLTSGSNDIILATWLGKAIRFSEKDVRPMGRTAHGVRGIMCRGNDHVVGTAVINPDEDGTATLLTITENGYGKRT
ncbi:DNA gyrase subunit A, partial [Candidatus Woesearchaeota archaeon]